ncbi:mycothione reductase [Corynebacterium sp. L4756]|uniref:mycothione reductase n=1 Tax=unclassified Corynebacterium TaxID=2624378 RepID=UPI00374CCE46
MTHYDLIIIGAGSGNSIPTPEHDDISIAIIEKGKFGGTCMNVGCIPTKMYVYAADVAYQATHSQKLGLEGEITNVDWQSIVDRVFTNRIDKIAEGGEAYRRGDETPNITVYDQHAEFIAEKTIKVGDDIITGDEIVIATGSRPQIPEAIANSGATFHTNETIMRVPEQPKSLIIVGGGFIAMEFAHVFDGLGTDVTIVNRSETLLRFTDKDISDRFNVQARERFTVKTGINVAGLEDTAHGIKATFDDGSTKEADAILVATGRIPNGDLMNLASAGIDMHDDGRIKVDEFGRTTADGVWALGDVSSPYMLKHVANAETKAVRHNMLHPEDMKPMPHKHVPAAIFTHPQIAYVGMTEEEASKNHDITVKVQNYGDVAYGWAMEDQDGICKLIADKNSGRLLGAHFYGPQASTLIQQMITVMAYDIDVRDFAQNQYWIHPALAEVTENALLGLEF